MTNMLERTSWSRHRKPYGFNKYVKNYELRPVAAEVWLGLCACSFLCMTHMQSCVSASSCLFGRIYGVCRASSALSWSCWAKWTGNRLYLSRQSHVQPLCSLISLTLSLLKQLLTFLNIEATEGIEFRNWWVHRQDVKMWHIYCISIFFNIKKSFAVKYFGVFLLYWH